MSPRRGARPLGRLGPLEPITTPFEPRALGPGPRGSGVEAVSALRALPRRRFRGTLVTVPQGPGAARAVGLRTPFHVGRPLVSAFELLGVGEGDEGGAPEEGRQGEGEGACPIHAV